MRPLVLAVVLGAIGLAKPADVLAVHRLPAGLRAASAAVANPGDASVAYLSSAGTLRLTGGQFDGRDYAVPPSCGPEAIFGGSVVLCAGLGLGQAGAQMLSLGDASQTPVGVSGLNTSDEESFYPSALGARWIEGSLHFISSGGSGKLVEVPVIVNRATGQTIDLTGVHTAEARSWGPRRFVNLSASRPDQPLCTPVRRGRLPYATPSSFGLLTKVGAWTLRYHHPRIGDDDEVIQRCGQRATLRVPGTQGALQAVTKLALDLSKFE